MSGLRDGVLKEKTAFTGDWQAIHAEANRETIVSCKICLRCACAGQQIKSLMDTSNLAERPRMRLCYICGKEFGSKSLEIHAGQCEKKFLAQQELLPL